jgi:hypothetical protein
LIVYPVSGYTGNRFYFAHHRLTDTETFELTKSVLTVLGEATYADIVVKLYPGQFDSLQHSTKRWLDGRSWSHIRTVTGGGYGSWIGAADLIVIDSPSTVLVQSVLGRSRLLVYAGVYRFVEIGLAALTRRASVFSDRAEFLASLEYILENRDFDNSSYRDDDFARSYCGEPDAEPAANIVRAVVRMAHAAEVENAGKATLVRPEVSEK